MDKPMCEVCGESEVSVSLAEAGVCDDCAKIEYRRVLSPLMGYIVCGEVCRHNEHVLACLALKGEEHDHG